MSLDTIERRLRETVAKATTSQWKAIRVDAREMEIRALDGFFQICITNGMQKDNADYIAAACPDNIRVVLAELDRLRAENAEYWRAANRLRNATEEEQESAAIHDLVEISTGNGYAHVPEPAVQLALEREKRMAGVLAEIEQTLGRALGYPVAGPEIGGDGVRVFTGEHTPATLAAEAARELERLRQQVGTLTVALERHGRHDLECSTQGGYNGETALAECDCGLDAALERRAGEGG